MGQSSIKQHRTAILLIYQQYGCRTTESITRFPSFRRNVFETICVMGGEQFPCWPSSFLLKANLVNCNELIGSLEGKSWVGSSNYLSLSKDVVTHGSGHCFGTSTTFFANAGVLISTTTNFTASCSKKCKRRWLVALQIAHSMQQRFNDHQLQFLQVKYLSWEKLLCQTLAGYSIVPGGTVEH